jgi:hypothetical protein
VVNGSVVVCDKVVRDRGNEVPNVIDLLDPLVQSSLGVVSRWPKGFTVGWFSTTAEVLLLSLVNDRNTILENSKSDSVLG